MPPRKKRATNTKGPATGGRPKRARRDSGESNARNQSQLRSAEQPRPTITSSQPILSWHATISHLNAEEMSSQIERYKHWRRDGSIHETTCRVCLKPGAVQPCHTCRLSFHTNCIPPECLREAETFFCSICVQRGWHTSPPVLTPPASPDLRSSQQPQLAATPAPVASSIGPGAMSIPSIVGTASGSQSTYPSSRAPVAQENTGNAPPLQENSDINQHAFPTTANPWQNGPNNEVQVESSRPRRQRKSRFATLSSEVDASLAVLYRELESISTLKMQVAELQSQNLHNAQMIQLRDNSIAMLRRDLDQQRSATAELAQYRANVAQHDSTKKDLDELRVKYAALEAELRESREQTTAAQELVNDWKGKLSQLLNT